MSYKVLDNMVQNFPASHTQPSLLTATDIKIVTKSSTIELTWPDQTTLVFWLETVEDDIHESLYYKNLANGSKIARIRRGANLKEYCEIQVEEGKLRWISARSLILETGTIYNGPVKCHVLPRQHWIYIYNTLTKNPITILDEPTQDGLLPIEEAAGLTRRQARTWLIATDIIQMQAAWRIYTILNSHWQTISQTIWDTELEALGWDREARTMLQTWCKTHHNLELEKEDVKHLFDLLTILKD